MVDKLVVAFLRKNKRLIIPNLGAFILKKFNDAGSIMVFVPFLKSDDGVLCSIIKDWMLVDDDDAGEILKEYVETIKTSINTRGKYVIAGLGTLKYNSNNIIELVKATPEDLATVNEKNEQAGSGNIIEKASNESNRSEEAYSNDSDLDNRGDVLVEGATEMDTSEVVEGVASVITERVVETVKERVVETTTEIGREDECGVNRENLNLDHTIKNSNDNGGCCNPEKEENEYPQRQNGSFKDSNLGQVYLSHNNNNNNLEKQERTDNSDSVNRDFVSGNVSASANGNSYGSGVTGVGSFSDVGGNYRDGGSVGGMFGGASTRGVIGGNARSGNNPRNQDQSNSRIVPGRYVDVNGQNVQNRQNGQNGQNGQNSQNVQNDDQGGDNRVNKNNMPLGLDRVRGSASRLWRSKICLLYSKKGDGSKESGRGGMENDQNENPQQNGSRVNPTNHRDPRQQNSQQNQRRVQNPQSREQRDANARGNVRGGNVAAGANNNTNKPSNSTNNGRNGRKVQRGKKKKTDVVMVVAIIAVLLTLAVLVYGFIYGGDTNLDSIELIENSAPVNPSGTAVDNGVTK